jgi:hypothetical protein
MLSLTANKAVGDGWTAKYVIRLFVVWYWLGDFKDHGFDCPISLNRKCRLFQVKKYWICNSGTADLLKYGFLSVVNWTHLKAVACGQLVERSDQKIVDSLMIQSFKLDPRTFPL